MTRENIRKLQEEQGSEPWYGTYQQGDTWIATRDWNDLLRCECWECKNDKQDDRLELIAWLMIKTGVKIPHG